jgi:hypothetical protein
MPAEDFRHGRNFPMSHRLRLAVLFLVLTASMAPCSMAFGDDPNSGGRTLTGKAALGDWTTDAPGVRRKVTLDDLAQPFATPSLENHPHIVKRPAGAWPKAMGDSAVGGSS